MLYGQDVRRSEGGGRTSRERWETIGAVVVFLLINGCVMTLFPLLLGVVISASHGITWGSSGGGAFMGIIVALAGPSVARSVREIVDG